MNHLLLILDSHAHSSLVYPHHLGFRTHRSHSAVAAGPAVRFGALKMHGSSVNYFLQLT